jgi:hypothetical protein
MAIDNTYTFALNESQIITRAMQLIGALASDESPTANDSSICSDFLNAMLKHWDGAPGLHQWKLTECTLLLNNSTSVYTLGPQSTSANCSETVVYATVATAIASAGSNATIVVNAVTGMTANDIVSLVQDDGTIVYGTISTINTGTSTLTTTITTTTTSAVGNAVFSYTSKIQKPLEIFDARRIDTSGDEIPLTEMSSQEYFELTNKSDVGTPVSFYYQPLINSTLFYVWPPSNDMTLRIRFRFSKQLSDLVTATNSPDVPQEFYLTIIYNLAVIIAPIFGRLNELDKIKPMADMFLKNIMDWDQEHTSIQLTPYTMG